MESPQNGLDAVILRSRSRSRSVHVEGTSKTHRAGSGENIFRQSKQKSARIVDPMRRIFVTNDGKDSADSPCEGFFRGALHPSAAFSP